MSLSSSPVVYPVSSSPPAILQKRKRPLPNEQTQGAKRRLLEQTGGISHYRKGQQENIPSYPSPELSSDNCDDISTEPTVSNTIERGAPKITAIKGLGKSIFSKTKRDAPTQPQPTLLEPTEGCLRMKTTSGTAYNITNKAVQTPLSYEQLIANRSTTAAGKPKKSYYGIDVYHLLDQAAHDKDAIPSRTAASEAHPSIESPQGALTKRRRKTVLWTEKYRARRFTDLVGDERTHRAVLRWLKSWDPIVFPGTSRPKPKRKVFEDRAEEQVHRKLMLLTGPPGLGKTTLAHVCARQAGYEVVEINASDERSRDVVKGQIRDIVGTENVKGVNTKGDDNTVRKSGRPVCVIVDEVDGVVGGGGGAGEGGFIKALMDLIALDQKNSNATAPALSTTTTRKSKKGDRFRILRPLILICNDVYHPSLRPLRSSKMAEIIHVPKPPLEKVITRLKYVFDKEGVPSDGDGVRRLCEAAWGVSNKRDNRRNCNNTGEGDMRGILVVGEWVASKLKAEANAAIAKTIRLTRSWVEKNMLSNLSHGGSAARGIGRGGAKEAVERIFQEGAGFPRSDVAPPATVPVVGPAIKCSGVSEVGKHKALDRLREIVDMSGETDRIMTDCFAKYPTQPFQDDTYLSKPTAAYEWLHFHDVLSSKVHAGQEWELSMYLSQPALGFHELFSSTAKHYSPAEEKRWDDEAEQEPLAFSGPRADYEASEILKQNKATLQSAQSLLSISLFRQFRSIEEISTDLLPHLTKILNPNIKPVVVGGSGDQRGIVSVRKDTERLMLERAVNVMGDVGVIFERNRIEGGYAGANSYVYRMEPPLDTLVTFDTAMQGTQNVAPPVRYAIRQALDQEYQKYLIRRSADARQARYKAGSLLDSDAQGNSNEQPNKLAEGSGPPLPRTKRDFFGRLIEETRPSGEGDSQRRSISRDNGQQEKGMVWVSFHEGSSTAVRKPITLEELMRGF